MDDFSRRDSLKLLSAALAGMSLAAVVGTALGADDAGAPPAFRGQHKPRPLSFDPSKLKGLSEKLIRSHWENNYGGAVRALNSLEQRLDGMLADKDLPAFVYGPLKREELLRTGSLVLHEYYFDNLGGDGKAAGAVSDAIGKWFGSYDRWAAEFSRIAMALAGGPGWVLLTYNLHTGELHNYWSYDHMHNAPTGLPLLVLDMYEHAFHMDYGAAAAKYIEAFMQNVRWEEVNRRYASAQRAASALKGCRTRAALLGGATGGLRLSAPLETRRPPRSVDPHRRKDESAGGEKYQGFAQEPQLLTGRQVAETLAGVKHLLRWSAVHVTSDDVRSDTPAIPGVSIRRHAKEASLREAFGSAVPSEVARGHDRLQPRIETKLEHRVLRNQRVAAQERFERLLRIGQGVVPAVELCEPAEIERWRLYGERLERAACEALRSFV
jgi:superoxide dismutase, Fe-Mn family